MAEQVVDPVAGARYAFRTDTDESGDEVLIIEAWVEPGGVVPPHYHPHHEERFEVLDGEMTFTVGRRKQLARAGEAAVVPPRTRHAFRNAGSTTGHMRVRVRPPMEQRQMLEDFAAAGRAGYLRRVGPFHLPTGPKGLRHVAALVRRYRENETTVVLLPPPALQRFVLYPLARTASID